MCERLEQTRHYLKEAYMQSRRLPILLVLTVALCAPAPAAGPKTYQVAASDGTKLATDVYLPDGKGPWPVILSRTPFHKAGTLETSKTVKQTNRIYCDATRPSHIILPVVEGK